jgi:hypothetical protein
LNDHEINEPCAVRKWFNLSHREGSVENVENIYHSMLSSVICIYTISVIVGTSTNVYYYLFLFENQNVFHQAYRQNNTSHTTVERRTNKVKNVFYAIDGEVYRA